MERTYISRQIAVYKTDKKLIEFNDKLRPAPIDNYAHIHAEGEKDGNGNKIYSLIGLVVQDYSKGTGDNTIRATVNLSPEDIQYIFCNLSNGVTEFSFNRDKIYGTPDKAGRSTVNKVRIQRAPKAADGTPRTYPWYIEVDNGTGIAAKAKTGGTYIQKNSFLSQYKIFVNINDQDFFRLMSRVSSYIAAWELAFGINLIRKGTEAIALNMQQAQG